MKEGEVIIQQETTEEKTPVIEEPTKKEVKQGINIIIPLSMGAITLLILTTLTFIIWRKK